MITVGRPREGDPFAVIGQIRCAERTEIQLAAFETTVLHDGILQNVLEHRRFVPPFSDAVEAAARNRVEAEILRREMAAYAVVRHRNGADGAFEHAAGDAQKVADINQLRIFEHGLTTQCASGIVQARLELRFRFS